MKGSISVCMCVYGYSKYLHEQTKSILDQTKKITELVVVEDYSELESPEDFLTEICSQYQVELNYIKPKINLGPYDAFRLAIRSSKGDLIFLSDQDDVWDNERVKKAIPYHQKSILVVSNGKSFDQETYEQETLYSELSTNFLVALIRNRVIGATLSIQGDYARDLARTFSFYPMHDWVIYLASIILKKKILLTNEELIHYRRHSNTYTGRSKNNLFTRIRFRASLLIKSLVIYRSSKRFKVR